MAELAGIGGLNEKRGKKIMGSWGVRGEHSNGKLEPLPSVEEHWLFGALEEKIKFPQLNIEERWMEVD